MGHYQIGPRIGAGGMAEVYLGTHQGLGGFRKLVVMKRLLGWQRSDGNAIESLLDEARIAATINHPNIVTTLDIGLDRGSPYIVLEYLSGEDLRYVLQQLHARDARMPLGVACRIGASIASALAQAHDIKLPDGTQRSIVHRDVTPSNIIVCYSGVTKLVDFGVARVSDAEVKTKSGTIKGKFSYLAPEQLTGAPLDGRTDVFQLGIVLWEMVTMRRLFEGKSDHERLNAVLNRPIRKPSELDPSVPPCLDRTIMRALERNPAHRHPTAQDLEEELHEAIAAIGGSGGDHSISKWTQTALADRHAWRLELERRTIAEAAAMATDDDVEIEIDGSPRTRVSTANSLRGLAVEASARPRRRGGGRYMLLAFLVIAAAVGWMKFYGPSLDELALRAGATEPAPVAPAPALADYEVDIRVTPADATIAIDGEIVAKGRYRARLVADGLTHNVTLTAPSFSTVQRSFQGTTALEITLDPLTPPPSEPVATREEAVPMRIVEEARSRRRHANRDVAPDMAVREPSETTDSGSATTAPPKTTDDFTPSSDNIDPFKAGN